MGGNLFKNTKSIPISHVGGLTKEFVSKMEDLIPQLNWDEYSVVGSASYEYSTFDYNTRSVGDLDIIVPIYLEGKRQIFDAIESVKKTISGVITAKHLPFNLSSGNNFFSVPFLYDGCIRQVDVNIVHKTKWSVFAFTQSEKHEHTQKALHRNEIFFQLTRLLSKDEKLMTQLKRTNLIHEKYARLWFNPSTGLEIGGSDHIDDEGNISRAGCTTLKIVTYDPETFLRIAFGAIVKPEHVGTFYGLSRLLDNGVIRNTVDVEELYRETTTALRRKKVFVPSKLDKYVPKNPPQPLPEELTFGSKQLEGEIRRVL